jgi:hypothetical protein
VPVLSVTESQNIDVAGQLVDVYEITYQIPNKPGVFTVDVPKAGTPLEAAIAAINSLTEVVTGMYAIP